LVKNDTEPIIDNEPLITRFDPLTRTIWPSKGQAWNEYDLKQFFINYIHVNLTKKDQMRSYTELVKDENLVAVLNELRAQIEFKLKPHQNLEKTWKLCKIHRKTFISKF